MSAGLANAAKMIEKGAPRLIQTEEELERYTDALFNLTAKDSPTSSEMEAIDLLSLLVETYESQHYAMPAAAPKDLVRFLMEQNGLQQRDLMAELGSESNVSLILSGKRNLTLAHIQKLGRRFGVSPTVFLANDAVVFAPQRERGLRQRGLKRRGPQMKTMPIRRKASPRN